ncbi:MXAN_6640 family putative metalloprotease [Nocardioides sp. C4-1]|uniref:MXAN_6640 family putative metalloprotease n=1 Tax=Nocardioides sp. C4-1 TaxID=3151851 RepID=UPI003267DDA3
MSLRPVRALVAAAAVAALVTTPLTSPTATAATAATPVAPATDGGKADRAASPAARRAADAVATARAVGAGRKAGDLTMALRDVANTRDALTGADRAAADRLLMRPTAPNGDGNLDYDGAPVTRTCSAVACVHYVTGAGDADAASPAYAQNVLALVTQTSNTYVTAGYRRPKADGNRGGDARIDVYLGDIGGMGLYGYCASDDPSRSTADYSRWAYCALDNDYSRAEFPTNTPLENLQVTVAHEYFHAVQFAYDRFEDSWLLEATATWVEDEMYDSVDDNRQYLRSSQLRRPGTPLDTFDATTGFHYGTWSFFRFLSERYPARRGVLPAIVLEVWQRADGSRGGQRDLYSWQAVNAVLKRRGTTGAKMLASYAAANRRPAASYREGRTYPRAPLAGRASMTPGKTVRAEKRMRHLTSATYRFTPKNLARPSSRLRLALDMAPRFTGSTALVTTVLTNGKVRTARIFLTKRGNKTKTVPFSSRSVRSVEVTLVNGSGRFECWRRPYPENPTFSCSGIPKDDRVVNRLTATAVR